MEVVERSARRFEIKITRCMFHEFATAVGAPELTPVVCQIYNAMFDALFPPYVVITWLAPASPWPLGDSLLGVLTGLAMFTLGGFVLGAVYGGAWGFWNDRLGDGRRRAA